MTYSTLQLQRQTTDAHLEKLCESFEIIRILDREMPGQLVSCFLYVASHNGCHKLSMELDLGLTSSSASRNTDILSKGRVGRTSEGLRLITKEVDPANRSRQILKLTPRGKALAHQMKSIVYEKPVHMGSSRRRNLTYSPSVA